MIVILPKTLQLLSVAFRIKLELPDDGVFFHVLFWAPYLGNSYLSLIFNFIYFFFQKAFFILCPQTWAKFPFCMPSKCPFFLPAIYLTTL